MPGKARLLNVKMLKSSMTAVLGVMVPGSTNHMCVKMQKSRSTCRSGSFGWITRKPIMPMAIWTISSACGWYMCVPCWRSVNS